MEKNTKPKEILLLEDRLKTEFEPDHILIYDKKQKKLSVKNDRWPSVKMSFLIDGVSAESLHLEEEELKNLSKGLCAEEILSLRILKDNEDVYESIIEKGSGYAKYESGRP